MCFNLIDQFMSTLWYTLGFRYSFPGQVYTGCLTAQFRGDFFPPLPSSYSVIILHFRFAEISRYRYFRHIASPTSWKSLYRCGSTSFLIAVTQHEYRFNPHAPSIHPHSIPLILHMAVVECEAYPRGLGPQGGVHHRRGPESSQGTITHSVDCKLRTLNPGGARQTFYPLIL